MYKDSCPLIGWIPFIILSIYSIRWHHCTLFGSARVQNLFTITRDATFPFLNGFPFFFLQNQKIPFFFNSRHENFPFLNGTPFFSDPNLWSPSSMWIWNKIWGVRSRGFSYIFLLRSSYSSHYFEHHNLLIELKKSGEKRKSGHLRSNDLFMFHSTCRPILRVSADFHFFVFASLLFFYS